MIDKQFLITQIENHLSTSDSYLVDVIINPGNVILVEIDNDKGVSVDDCANVNRFVESILNRDEEDFELTVSSVGLTSPFKTLRQYQKNIGNEVEVLSKKGQKLYGVLKSASKEEFVLTISKKVRPKGAKRRKKVSEDLHFGYEEVKYTKYLIRFK